MASGLSDRPMHRPGLEYLARRTAPDRPSLRKLTRIGNGPVGQVRHQAKPTAVSHPPLRRHQTAVELRLAETNARQPRDDFAATGVEKASHERESPAVRLLPARAPVQDCRSEGLS